MARRILDAGHAAVRPGATTDDIDRVVRSVASVEFCRHAAVVEVWRVVLKQATAPTQDPKASCIADSQSCQRDGFHIPDTAYTHQFCRDVFSICYCRRWCVMITRVFIVSSMTCPGSQRHGHHRPCLKGDEI